MKHRTIAGGEGHRLHLVETGDPGGRPVLFLHGCSQSWLAWRKQLTSDLASRWRLVAMDLRGHGLSETPRQGYEGSRPWADDVDATIRELELDRPVLCGWSYGPLVILDYIRHYGEDRIGGVHFVDGITGLGDDASTAALTTEFLSLVPGLLSNDVGESVSSLESLLRMCFVDEPSEVELYTMLGYNASVPPFVREAMLTRTVNNDDLLPEIRTPVLLTHGARDAVVRSAMLERHRESLPRAEVHLVDGAGHAPFWETPEAFNRRLDAFCETCGAAERIRANREVGPLR